MNKTIGLITAALLLLTACNQDGVIIQAGKPTIALDNPTGVYAVEQGRSLTINASVENGQDATISWTHNGTPVGDQTAYTALWEQTGSHTLTLSAKNESGETSKQLVVVVLDTEQFELFRPARAGHSAHQNKVYEWRPAPGQFIGETGIGGMTGSETSPEAARAWAEERLKRENFVSLGSFGGYLIAGFDHSIPARGDETLYDFAVLSNTIDTSAEPGVVWVMQDTNANGEPDDRWYELRGAATAEQTTRDYAVTYFRPEEAGADVLWTDSEGTSGKIAYLPEHHDQDSYYPAWITDKSYTLRGTRLKARNVQNPTTGMWSNDPYAWGYVDNDGSDAIRGSSPRTGFRIANAIHADGTQAGLLFVDFVKVQCGLNAQSGVLGELSTEVCGFEDLSIQK